MQVKLQPGDLKVTVRPDNTIGAGGEAEVFRIGSGRVLKLFKPHTHPDYDGLPHEQAGARERLELHQRKLPDFPKGLPDRVITPQLLAYKRGRIVGYAMPMLEQATLLRRFAEKGFRNAGVTNEDVIATFTDLHGTVKGSHQEGVVIGDFNDLNVMVRNNQAFLIDADSMQFGPYLCKVFTQRFVDPTLCDPRQTKLILCKPHTAESDWYAFEVMLMQSFLFVDPYGGVYRPKDKRKRMKHGERPLHRVTVFDPEVKYPKPAIPFGVLPDELLQHFHLVFKEDERGEFPLSLLTNMRWTNCTQCGLEHARPKCPDCQQAAPAAIREAVEIRGQVTARRQFRTPGVILHAAMQGGKLCFLYHEDGAFCREGGRKVLPGALDPRMRFRIWGDKTVMAKDNTMVTLQEGEPPKRGSVGMYRGVLPELAANGQHLYWVEGGSLKRDGHIVPFRIGDVLPEQTRFWVGETFGFGFYRAGSMSVAFVFDTKAKGIKDTVKLPTIRGQVLDAVCVFSQHRAWFFMVTEFSGKTHHMAVLLKKDGTVVASAEAEAGDDNWLGEPVRGATAVGNFLLKATDEGVVRIEADGDHLVVTKNFPDTEPFVDQTTQLFAGSGGLYAVSRREVHLLEIK